MPVAKVQARTWSDTFFKRNPLLTVVHEDHSKSQQQITWKPTTKEIDAQRKN